MCWESFGIFEGLSLSEHTEPDEQLQRIDSRKRYVSVLNNETSNCPALHTRSHHADVSTCCQTNNVNGHGT